MNKLLLQIAFLLFLIPSKGQIEAKLSNEEKNILHHATEMGQLYLNKNYEMFVGKLYPGLIKIVGGKDKMLEVLTNANLELTKQSISIDSLKFSNPNKIINTGIELQTTLTEIVFMSIPNGKMVKKSTVIAISLDNGITWFFIDTSGKDLKSMQQGFPKLSNDLIIPKDEKPIVYKNQ